MTSEGFRVTGTPWHRAEQLVAIAGDEAIDQIGNGTEERKAQHERKCVSAGKTGEQGQKGVQPAADAAVWFDEKCHIRTAWPIFRAEFRYRFLALIWHKLHVTISSQPFNAFLRHDAQTAFPVVDESPCGLRGRLLLKKLIRHHFPATGLRPELLSAPFDNIFDFVRLLKIHSSLKRRRHVFLIHFCRLLEARGKEDLPMF